MSETNTALAPEEITTKDVNKAWARMFFACEIPHSLDRYIAASLLWGLMPILRKLYKDEEALKDAYERHLLFYNSQISWGSGPIMGILISMEAQRAKEEYNNEEIAVTDDAIYNIKAGLMGALAGIGDSIDEGVVLQILVAIALPWAQNGNPLGALAPWIIFMIYQYVIGLYFCRMGFRLGRDAATEIVGSDASRNFLDGLSIVGLFMMGILAGNYVDITSSLQINLGNENVFVLQDILDQLLPGMLPLVAVLGLYFYFRKKEFNMIKAIVGLTIILGILAIVGIL